MTISHQGQAVGTTSAVLPTHQAGDFLFFSAFRDGSNSLPGLPSGWTDWDSHAGDSRSGRIAYLVATGSSETDPSSSNATECAVQVYRSDSGTLSAGATAQQDGSGTTVTYPALTLTTGDGSSWVVGVGMHRETDTSLETPPTGMTNRSTTTNTGEHAVHDTNAGVSSWASDDVSVGGTSNGWLCFVAEIQESGASSGGALPLVSGGLVG